MPKLKTSRGAAKRFKVSGGGKIRRAKAYRRHQLSCKTRKQKRQLKAIGTVDKTNHKAIRKLIPYL
jgi:large subunit ribosomal protein L35